MKEKIEFVQQALNEQNRNAGTPDGLMGTNTRNALNTVIGIPKDWNDNRKVIGCIQLLAMAQELEISSFDGYWGPETEHAYDALNELKTTNQLPANWRNDESISGNEAINLNPNQWPVESEDELIKYYGPVGRNQTKIQLPYPHRLSWQTDKVVRRFSCHEKVHDSLLRILTRVHDHYGVQKISELGLDMFGGCLNVRKIRGGNRYSTHSWGIALDYDPARNKLRWNSDKAEMAKPAYDEWWKIWEDEGWVSLGRLKNYDWMHIQACRR